MLIFLLPILFAHVWHMGGALAITVSYNDSKSVSWAVVHGLLAWFYLAYRWVVK